MGDRAQAIISRQMADGCDILVGIFWTRVGTPTGGYASGTIEEIERHLAADRPALLYFSSAPVQLDSVDPDSYSRLKAFKASCMDRGLIQQYSSQSEFQQLFQRHLAKTMNGLGGPGQVPAPLAPSVELSDEARRLLRDAANDQHGTIIVTQSLAGWTVQVGGVDLVEPKHAREEARWRAAVSELLDAELIEPVGNKGELFSVTNLGYKAADKVEP